MKKIIKKYWGVLLFYLVLVGSVSLVNYRLSSLEEVNVSVSMYEK